MTNTDTTIQKLANVLLPEVQATYDRYLNDRQATEEQGLSPYCCEHGTSLRTGYDNICAPCEQGVTASTEEGAYAIALDLASERHAEANERIARVRALTDTSYGETIPTEVRKALVDWAIEPLA